MALEDLNLENNLFWGLIPSSLSSVDSLVSVRLNLNRFDGDVPDTICGLRLFDEGGFREGLVVLEADCYLNRGFIANNCSCCTECCDRTAMTCLVVDTSPIAAEPGPTCVELFRWDRLNGVIPSI